MQIVLLVIVVLVFIEIGECLYVDGPHLYDDDGYKVLIRGISRPSLEWSPVGEHLGLDDYQKMKDWGANCIRLSLNQDFWLRNSSQYNPIYRRIINIQVKDIRSLNMSVILDLHWSDDGDLNITQSGQKKMADRNSVEFWREISSMYSNDSNIIFELYNEPQNIPWRVWMNGGTVDGVEYIGMQELYKTIRENADNVVIVNGINYGYNLIGLKQYPMKGYNIIFGTHPYNFTEKTPEFWDNNFGYLTSLFPLIATEFGEFKCNPDYVKTFILYADRYNIHWLSWAWYPKGCDFPSIIDSWDGKPNQIGEIIKESLQKARDSVSKSKS
ncbi:galactose-binding domain-containing protein [Tieghemostelium lacteum]|uniref:Galactose-binding domain-containing protein n=1 Tax=Tieghemostelium lacteum TaxID=361077 RepID=A0A152A925_TIELA|nr:galactose-binding domain-containing protein [Tieghemostelium lacteum]|eukprot:KYR02625.1 galactose-binding domain-containing protein [Tieghemostelium lacteum]